MDDVLCNEDDKNISNCRARLMLHNCGHGKDIWLQCKGKFLKSNNKALGRLKFKFTSAISKHIFQTKTNFEMNNRIL